MKVRVKRIRAPIIAGLLLLMLVLPQLTLAAGPEISNVVVLDHTATTATIFWTTNTTSDSRVNYGITTALGTPASDSSMVTTHFILLTGLTPGTTYYFEVVSGNSTDNNGGAYYSFTTEVGYSITLDPVEGVYGDLINVTVAVTAAGTYHVCWDSLKAANVLEWGEDKLTFTATTAGSRTLMFSVPKATKDSHKVYLATDAYAKKAEATFKVYTTVKIVEIDPMDVDPMVGPVGTEVTISCYGFKASQDIRLKFDDTVTKTGTTDKDYGSWTVSSYTIPATPAGGYTFKVEAKEGTVWVTRGGKHFKVTPEITAPSSGKVGHTIEVKGTGFQSEEKDIEVTFRRQSTDVEVVVKESILADENGSWTATIVIPPLQRGTYTISASGELTRARDVTGIKDFVVGAGILVEPDSAYVGDTITVAGGGFATGETGIKVTFDGKAEATGITAEIDGTWEFSFVLPASSYGSHIVSASGDITKPAVETTLNTKAMIESVSPIEGAAPGDSVTLTGSGFSGNKKLTVTVAGKTVSGDLGTTKSNGDVVISFRVPASTPGKQTLVVKDEGGAEDSVTFTVKTKVLPSPLPILPQDESKLRSGIVTFQWQGITGGSEITYTLQISETAGFTSIFRSRSDIEELSTQLPKEYALPKGTYYWRVKAVDDYGNESPWSDSSSFTASPIPTWVWVVVGLVVLIGLMVVAYRETKFKVTE